MSQVPKAGGKPAHIMGGRSLAAVMTALFVTGGLIAQHGLPFAGRTPTSAPGTQAAIDPAPRPAEVAEVAELPAPQAPEPAEAAAPAPETPPSRTAAEAPSEPAQSAAAAGDGVPAAEPPAAATPVPALPGPRLVPLPVRRPSELKAAILAETPRPRRQAAIAQPPAQAIPQKEDERSFVEKLFGIDLSSPAPAPALAYASLENKGAADRSFRQRLSAVPPAVTAPVPSVPSIAGSGGVAVYDITAQVVTLPNGEKLEAHSGLGDIMDNPAHVHVPMRGATPIGTYDLTERERLFHGVRALRLNPVGGSEAVHGRVGLLAHTFMLGPKGASNGCVSFRNYERFLQAYLSGEVRRLVVVAGI